MSNPNTQNDFSKGSIVKNIMNLAIPMTLAQLINVLYNIVDRIYIGRIPDHATLSLTGIGLSLPIITLVIAFANLFGMGGAPLCSIERGRGDIKEAEAIMGNSFSMMFISGVLLTLLCLIFRKPMLYLFGASDATYPYANAYITIYLLGSLFVMVGLGMNSFINSQGFGRIGMMTVLLGAAANILLDPIFIFVLHMGIRGAALLRDRFGIVQKMDFYTPEELQTIVLRTAGVLNVEIDKTGAYEIARRSRGTPRLANRLLKRVRDFAQVKYNGVITKEVADFALDILDVDKLGLDNNDRAILHMIIDKFSGGPVGLETLAAALGEDAGTLEDVYEPYLLMNGLLNRTPRGRMATEAAYRHLGYAWNQEKNGISEI